MKIMWGEDKPWKTKAKFWAWVRSGLRRSVWMKHPIKIEHIKSNRYKAPLGVAGKDVWCCTCAICNETHRQTNCQVDHIQPAGKLNSIEDVMTFVERLAFIDDSDIRILCKHCHSIVSYAERYGLTFEKARDRKEEIAKRKRSK